MVSVTARHLAAEGACHTAGEICGRTHATALQHAQPAAPTVAVATRQHHGAAQQLEADGAEVVV